MAAALQKTVLIVDDSDMTRALLRKQFADSYAVLEAKNGQEALETILADPDRLAAVLLDLNMPVMAGLDVLRTMDRQGLTSRISVFIVTAESDSETLRACFSLGAEDVIEKPITPFFIKCRVEKSIRLKALLQRQSDLLSEQVKTIDRLNRSMIETLAAAIEFRSCESGGHVRRLYHLTRLLLTETPLGRNFSVAQVEQIAEASVMHDLGKIAIPDSILNKPGSLTAAEFEIIKTHAARGAELIESISQEKKNTVYQYARDICRWHHERYDGGGYPDHLRGEEIPLWAQVVGLADCYDALTHRRVYKEAFSAEESSRMILGGECGVFSPELLAAFRELSPCLPDRLRECRENEVLTAVSTAGTETAAVPSTAFQTDGLLRGGGNESFIFHRCIGGAAIFSFTGDSVRCLLTNEQFFEAVGTTEEAYEPYRENALAFVHEEDRPEVLEAFRTATRAGQGSVELRVLGASSGEPHWIKLSLRLLAAEGERSTFFAMLENVTQRTLLQARLQKSDRELLWQSAQIALLADMPKMIVFDFDVPEDVMRIRLNMPDGKVQDRSLAGYLSGGRPRFVHPEDAESFVERLREAAAKPTTYKLLYRCDYYGDGYRWYRLYASSLAGEDGTVYRVVGRIDNFDDVMEQEEQLRRAAQTDIMTGLLNRAATEQAVTGWLSRSGEGTLLLLDLDDFKGINDHLGHLFGDAFLREVGSVLRRTAREGDILGRIGGDEFVIFLPGLTDSAAALRRGEEISHALRQIPVPEIGRVMTSVGIALSTDDTAYASLFSRADNALYRAKGEGKDRCILYDPKKERTAVVARGAAGRSPDIEIDFPFLWEGFMILYRTKNLDTGLSQLLAYVGSKLGVSRTYIFRMDAEDGSLCMTHEWCDEGVPSCKANLQRIPLSASRRLAHVADAFQDGIFTCYDAGSAPAIQRTMMASDVCSTIRCALGGDSRFEGMMGADECREHRFFSTPQIEALRRLGKIVSLVLEKR